MSETIKLGTRGSRLALAQSGQVARQLQQLTGRPVELVPVVTRGDVSRASLAQIGGIGVFATALRDALLAGDIDLVVHSCKDLPTAEPEDLSIAAIPKRADPHDVLVARGGVRLADLAPGSRIGTGSPRRQAQVRRARPDVTVIDIRGNVDTRLGRLDDDLDAVVLAAAGLARLGAAVPDAEQLPLETWTTAPAQGALAVETRIGDEALVVGLDHAPTRIEASIERAVLAGLGAGCAAPVGVHAHLAEGQASVIARVYDADASGDVEVRRRLDVPATLAEPGRAAIDEITIWARQRGEEIAQELVAGGADDVVRRAGERNR